MIARNLLLAVISAIFGGLVTLYVLQPESATTVASKADRLSGPSTETAFLPERFGVPGSAH